MKRADKTQETGRAAGKKPKRGRFAEYWFYDLTKATTALPGLIAFRPKIIYENAKAKKRIRGGALVIANHVGFADPIYLMYVIWYRRHRFICMIEFFKSRARWLFEHFLCIPVDRENFSMDTFREITGHLSAGHLVSMYPEGHVNSSGDGRIDSFKSGMVLMANKAKAPIVCVYIKKPAHWYSRLIAAVGEPVDIGKTCGERMSFAKTDEVTRLLYEKEEKLRKLCEGN